MRIDLFAVFDAYGRQLSALMPYKKAHDAKRYIDHMSQTGVLQATIAVPPFKVKRQAHEALKKAEVS